MPLQFVSQGIVTIPVAGYTGVGDIAPGALLYFGTRSYSAAYAASGTNPCVDVVASGGGGLTTFNILSTGLVDVAGIAAYALANGSCLVQKWWDQTGNGNHVSQSITTSAMVNLTSVFLNGVPVGAGAGGEEYEGTTFGTLGSPTSLYLVGNRTGVSDTRSLSFNGATPFLGYGSSANQATMFNGTNLNATASDNAWHVLLGLSDGTASSKIAVDGAVTTGSAGASGTLSGQLGFFCQNGGFGKMTGSIAEAAAWATQDKSANFAAITANARLRWAF